MRDDNNSLEQSLNMFDCFRSVIICEPLDVEVKKNLEYAEDKY